MSQIVTRKGPKGEDKEKRQTDSPVKEMKKKIAANAEKEKQAAEKNAEKSVQSDKKAEKSTEKVAEKPAEKEKKEKPDKSLDKSIDRKDKAEKSAEKTESTSDKKENTADKASDKKEKQSDKKDGPAEKASDSKEKNGKMDLSEEKAKKPETKVKENGAATNGEQNGDTSKLLKLKDDALPTDRKLRSADSPKPQDKKIEKVQEGKKSDSPKKDPLKAVQEEPSKQDEKDKNETEVEIEVAVEIENEDERRVKADTNYSKSRVKVSPYRRSSRLADQTDLSLLANYTGNNTTMEMDITESSLDEPESPYLSGLRSIRARRSYRVLHEVALRTGPRAPRPEPAGAGAEAPQRPTGTVVGRKRRPEAAGGAAGEAPRDKRPRLLERLARPFRAAPPPARRAAEVTPLVLVTRPIVGINTDLPLSAPVASADAFDPEAIKPQTCPAPLPADGPLPAPVSDRDGKRCIVM
ncbi:translation initiation factor IF-2-like isoform X5 [Nymphalis io]|uniref:translation initiation factor IF-2-like isoform X5 n=1 Tax=Inachis io TaxID=171585 RepID=UPI002166E750|nr:translation initiation factor IF-2-like isoform X5 [Nymphalis io]